MIFYILKLINKEKYNDNIAIHHNLKRNLKF